MRDKVILSRREAIQGAAVVATLSIVPLRGAGRPCRAGPQRAGCPGWGWGRRGGPRPTPILRKGRFQERRLVRRGRSLREEGLRPLASGPSLSRLSRDVPVRRGEDRRRVLRHARPHARARHPGRPTSEETRLLRQAADAHRRRVPCRGPLRSRGRRRHAGHHFAEYQRGGLPDVRVDLGRGDRRRARSARLVQSPHLATRHGAPARRGSAPGALVQRVLGFFRLALTREIAVV